jgi:hypothetical protein
MIVSDALPDGRVKIVIVRASDDLRGWEIVTGFPVPAQYILDPRRMKILDI